MTLNFLAFIITSMKSLTLVPLSFSSSCICFLLLLSLCTFCFCEQNSDPVQCVLTEQLALIDLKYNFTDNANRLSSWVGKDCCSWSGVVCDNFTGHVLEIHLRGPDDGIHSQMLGGTISPSVINLLQLRYLDLSSNDFEFSTIPSFIGSFQNLIYLNLSGSNFGGDIPHQLGNLSTLRVLDLHQNPFHSNLQYSESLKWLKNLKGLQYLDMGGIDLAKASDWFPVISNLTSLLQLHLSSCRLYELPNSPTTVSFTSLIVLDLSHNRFDNMLLPGWIFSLRNVASLDLTDCHISGVNPVTHGGFHSMPSLRDLRLSTNAFVNSSSLLNGLSSLSNLRSLDISLCHISSPILRNLQNLPLIVHLDVSQNQIVEEIPKTLSNLCNFIGLNMGYNKFFGNVSELLDRFCECESPKLELLDFSYNYQLIGQLPERLGKLKNLVSIDLSYNQLTGTIPDTIGGLSMLEFLALSYNKLNESLPQSIGRLSKLYSLYLDHNLLTGIVTKHHFVNLTSLTFLWVGDNKLVFQLNVNDWVPPFSLMELSIASCSLGPQFPSWIQTQKDLEYLDVSNANISDTIPNWIWPTFTCLDYFNISHNNIQGKLGDVTYFEPQAVIDLSNNHIHGPLPGNFNRADLDFLDLSNNNLSGSLQQFLCSRIHETRRLYLLNLANNSMSGVIPNCWMKWKSLVSLNLEKNQFFGIIPSSLGNISLLQSLDMDDNRLSGNLPPWLLNSKSLVVIELAGNELRGEITSSIGRGNTSLRVLSLRSNKFEGKIPDEICHLTSVQILDLAHNDLSGRLPTCFTNFTSISRSEALTPIVVFLPTTPEASLVTKGNTYTYRNILYQVTLLDLSNNKFSGSIPGDIVGLLGLRYLNLSHNDLTGTIPNLFNQTGILESLDLSMNHLHGNIPLTLSQLTALSWLNLSDNNLTGSIPTGPQFQTFSPFIFTGNELCGAPLPACILQNNDNAEVPKDGHDEPNGLDWILVIVTLVGLFVGFWIVVAPLFLCKQWRDAYYQFLEEIGFKLQKIFFLLFLRLTKRSRSR